MVGWREVLHWNILCGFHIKFPVNRLYPAANLPCACTVHYITHSSYEILTAEKLILLDRMDALSLSILRKWTFIATQSNLIKLNRSAKIEMNFTDMLLRWRCAPRLILWLIDCNVYMSHVCCYFVYIMFKSRRMITIKFHASRSGC